LTENYQGQNLKLNANFIGTDYTYAYCQRYRNTIFRDNTIDEGLLIGVEAKPEETKGGARDSSTGLVEAGEGQPALDEAGAQAAEL
jgi:hypothetical protein